MYSVFKFNEQTSDIVFQFSDQHLYTINLKNSNLTQYGSVNPMYHYFDTKNNTIVKVTEPNNLRTINIDNCGVLYRKATQFEFDKWMAQEFPDSDNAKIFNILINSTIVNEEYTTFDTHNSIQNKNKNLFTIGASESESDSDSEDPYFRGDIEEFIHGC
jgi:hypothetical protein